MSAEKSQIQSQAALEPNEKGSLHSLPEDHTNTVASVSPSTHSDNPFFIPNLEYTPAEEAAVVRILDWRLFPWILLTTFVLNMDRTNNSNAISDNLPADLGFNLSVVNTATAMYSVLFSVFCFTGAVIAKYVGPARWIPILMFAWGLVTGAHALITNKQGYLACRAWIAITEGGVIPATLVYLGSFYKSFELATRLAWFWGVQAIASAVSGLMASGLLQLRGRGGLEGWKWLFIVDCIATLVVSVLTWFYLPKDSQHTKGGIRGWKPWLTDRQVQIAVTRVIRDDPAKRYYERTVTWRDVKDAATDIALWGHLIITAVGLTPSSPLSTYLPTVIKNFHFDVFAANALTAPPYVLQCASSVLLIWHSDRTKERGLHGTFAATWFFAGWVLLRFLPHNASRGVKYFAAVITASWPTTHPLNIAWMSQNTGSVGKRTVASGAVIGAANIYGTWASQIYQNSDSPDFRKGNTANVVISGFTILLWIAQKSYYKYLNAKRERQWAELDENERRAQELQSEKLGNESITYRFAT